MLRLWLIACAFLSGAAAALYALLPDEREEAMRRRLRELGHRDRSPELERPWRERLFAPLAQELQRALGQLAPARLRQHLEGLLREAGRPPRADALIAVKLLLAAAGLLAGGMLRRAGLGVMAAGLLWLLPDAQLRRQAALRRRAIERALPDVLDLLCISVEAGLGFDGAMQKVAEKFAGPVAAEFSLYLREVTLGRPREEALRAMAARTRLGELQALVSVVIQADKLGVSLARVLRLQAEELRVRRRQRAEERAVQIPVKLLFPLVFFVFPAVFAVLLGPAVLHLLALWQRA